jgi:DNA-binding beta-propeller fold protein YncE
MRRSVTRRLFCIRILAILGAFAATVAGTRMASAHGAVLVLNSADASMSVVDIETQKETRRIPVLREPHHLMLSPDHKELLVGDTVGNEMLFLDPKTFEIRRRVPVADPYQLGFSPDGKLLVVNGLARNQVDVYDAVSLKLVKRFPVSSMPSHMAFAPDSSTVYVSLQGSGHLVAIDLRKEEIVWNVPVGPAPAGVMWHDGQVLVAVMGSDHVVVVDPANGNVTRRIHTGKGAHQLFYSPDRKLIYVNNRVEGTSVTLDARTLNPVRTYKLPGGPDDIDFAADGKAWFTLRFAHKVAVLDPVSGNYDTVVVGRSPHGIFVSNNGTAH